MTGILPKPVKSFVAGGIAKLRELYGAQFSQVFRTITCDNGSEFTCLQEVVTEAKVYYAHPYPPWERGTNEKQNALVRYFIPNGMDMTNLSMEEVQRVEDWINTLPRDCCTKQPCSSLNFVQKHRSRCFQTPASGVKYKYATNFT